MYEKRLFGMQLVTGAGKKVQNFILGQKTGKRMEKY